MVGVTRIKVRETAAKLEALIQKESNPKLIERTIASFVLAAITRCDEHQCHRQSDWKTSWECAGVVEPVS